MAKKWSIAAIITGIILSVVFGVIVGISAALGPNDDDCDRNYNRRYC